MKINSIAIVTFLLLSNLCLAQKIKYKDLFPVLNAKNYAEGGPQLVQYLADPKNQEEANPNLQMGLMLENQFLRYDVVDDSAKVYSSGDSAVIYLSRAKSLIDEKELKKNDEYYQAFFRRDLRTGEFGIKVSDVHLDIEKKVDAIQKRISDVKSMHREINKVGSSHKAAMGSYQSMVDKYDSYNEMLLSASAEDQEKLALIESNGRVAANGAKSIKELAGALGSDKYQEDVELKSIEKFGQDGLEASNLKSGSISIWDFESWARDAQSEIRGGVGLFKTMVVNYSKELRDKKAKVKNSQNVEGVVVPVELLKQFDKYDPESTVEKLLKIETFETRVIKNVDLQINPDLMDSSKVGAQLKIYSEAKEDVDAMNVLVQSITADDLEKAKKKYPDYMDSFFQSYGTASKYVQEMRDWSGRNKEWIGNSVDYWAERNRWGIIEKEGEEEKKVALFELDTPENGVLTLGVLRASIPEYIVYGGDMNSKKGFVSSFGEDRKQQWSLEYALPGTEAYEYDYDTLPAPDGATSFYVYNKNATTNNFSAVSFSLSGQLNWAVNVSINKAPVDFKFDNLTQELTILLYPEEQLPLDSDELGYVVIDRTGNAR